MVIKGCFFHYTQCIWRKTYYKENDGITKLVRRAAVLPLVPQNEIEDVWFNALQDIGDPDNVLDTTTFTDYVTERWVETHIFFWNHYLTRPQTIYTSSDRDNYQPVCSGGSPPIQKTNLQTYRLHTSATERHIPPGVSYSDSVIDCYLLIKICN